MTLEEAPENRPKVEWRAGQILRRRLKKGGRETQVAGSLATRRAGPAARLGDHFSG